MREDKDIEKLIMIMRNGLETGISEDCFDLSVVESKGKTEVHLSTNTKFDDFVEELKLLHKMLRS